MSRDRILDESGSTIPDFAETPNYALQPRTTKTGHFYVVRREWELMFGKPVLNEYAHRVSGWLDNRFEQIDFCIKYATNNPGCVARAEDVLRTREPPL